jgi:hypothetical protein
VVQEKEADCLHCKVNEVVQEHIEGLKTIDLSEAVSKVGESLVDLILLGPKGEWGNLLAEAIREVGHMFLEKSGGIEEDTVH